MRGYPKRVEIKDGIEVVLRPMVPDDLEGMHRFLTGLPEEDRLYLKEDVTKRSVVEKWIKELNYKRVLPIVAEYGEKIIANGSLHMHQFGWMRHVGEVRCAVAHEYQKKWLGTLLLKTLVQEGMKRGLEKLVAYIVENQIGALHAFERAGFQKEAVLKDHVMDLYGRKRNLIIMTNDITHIWHEMENLIHEMEKIRM